MKKQWRRFRWNARLRLHAGGGAQAVWSSHGMIRRFAVSGGGFARKAGRRIFTDGFLPVFQMFARDVKLLLSRKQFFITVLIICILPTVYSNVNLFANWNPYGSIGNLPVAIVNNDQGAVYGGKIVDFGGDIVKQMKNDHTLKWAFVDDWQGNDGVNNGAYYAMIEIPDNFSERLVTLDSPTPQKPVLRYVVNQKINATAPKIIGAVQEALVQDIQQNYIGTVTKQLDEQVQSDYAKGGVPDKQTIRKKLAEIDSSLSRLQSLIGQAKDNQRDYQSYLKQLQNEVPVTLDQISQAEKVLTASGQILSETLGDAKKVYGSLLTDLRKVQGIDGDNQKLLSQLRNITDYSSTGDLTSSLSELQNICEQYEAMLNAHISDLSALNQTWQYSGLTDILNAETTLSDDLKDEDAELGKVKGKLDIGGTKAALGSDISVLSGLSSEISAATQNLSDALGGNAGGFDLLFSTISEQINDTNIILEDLKTIVLFKESLLLYGGNTAGANVQSLAQFGGTIKKAQQKLESFSGVLSSTDGDVDNIVKNVMGQDATELADFISSPVDVKQVDVYPSGPYGYGLTPFYTTLSIWVGIMLLSSMVACKGGNIVNGKPLSYMQNYFGRFLLYLLLSQIQMLISLGGEIVCLGVRPANMALYFLIGEVCSVSFTLVLFTFSYILGTVGTGIALIVMIFQLAGSGGIFPLETSPNFFSRLAPFWPFTYADSAFREALAGPLWSTVWRDIRVLSIYAAVSLAVILAVSLVKFVLAKRRRAAGIAA